MNSKRRWLGVCIALLLVAAVPAVAFGQGSTNVPAGAKASSSQKPPRQGEWRGGTSQGNRLIFDVLNTRKGLMVQAMYVEADAQCGDFGIGFIISGFHRLVQSNGRFRIHLYDPFFGTFDFNGKLLRSRGGGLLGMSIPLLNKDGSAQVCSSGDIAWKAAPPPAGQAASGTSPRVKYLVRVTQSKSGHVSWTVDKG
jgi:hypothetical protein